jgi:hypothetical protein
MAQIDRWSPKCYPINSADANTPRKSERVANDYRGLCEWPLMSELSDALRPRLCKNATPMQWRFHTIVDMRRRPLQVRLAATDFLDLCVSERGA